MTPEEKDRLIAERLMGWDKIHEGNPHEQYIANGEFQYFINPTRKPSADNAVNVWHPSTSLDQCHLAEEKITEERWNIYVHKLLGVCRVGGCSNPIEVIRKTLHATAEQKVKAMVAMLTEDK